MFSDDSTDDSTSSSLSSSEKVKVDVRAEQESELEDAKEEAGDEEQEEEEQEEEDEEDEDPDVSPTQVNLDSSEIFNTFASVLHRQPMFKWTDVSAAVSEFSCIPQTLTDAIANFDGEHQVRSKSRLVRRLIRRLVPHFFTLQTGSKHAEKKVLLFLGEKGLRHTVYVVDSPII